MPELTAGMRNTPQESKDPTTQALVVNAMGAVTAAIISVVAMVNTPVGERRTSGAATKEPARPDEAPAACTRPIAAGCTPARSSRNVRATNTKLVAKLNSPPQVRMARTVRCFQTNEKPARASAQTRPVVAVTARIGVLSDMHATANTA